MFSFEALDHGGRGFDLEMERLGEEKEKERERREREGERLKV